MMRLPGDRNSNVSDLVLRRRFIAERYNAKYRVRRWLSKWEATASKLELKIVKEGWKKGICFSDIDYDKPDPQVIEFLILQVIDAFGEDGSILEERLFQYVQETLTFGVLLEMHKDGLLSMRTDSIGLMYFRLQKPCKNLVTSK